MITVCIADAENLKIKEKLNSGEQILEKIMNMGGNFFPNDKDRSFFWKITVFLQHHCQLLHIMRRYI